MTSLKSYNTFGIDVSTVQLIRITELKELKKFSFTSVDEYFILGGGSNLLLTKDLDIPVLKNEIYFKKNLKESETEVLIEIGGGENWHETVLWTIEQGYGGFENLSYIPGTVGASPIQNIGAYGVEIKDLIIRVHAYDMLRDEKCVFEKDECQFAYRDSFFKKPENKGRYFITSVEFKLHQDPYRVKTSYGVITSKLNDKNISSPTIKDVSEAIISIRKEKLPDPKEIGNSGSFFKNPIITKLLFETIQSTFPNAPSYPINENNVKIPAGWLIEKCGWKGKVVGNTGNYKNQALIIVNHGGATGQEIFHHACNVQKSVEEKFGISLDFEVNVV